MRAKLITVEGIEGVGKSTNIQFIAKSIKENLKIDVLITREPGGTPLGEEIREVLLKSRKDTFDPMAELLLMFAARAQHISQVIKPALARGVWVVCDRFTDASFAYQGSGRGLDIAKILALERLVQEDLTPDVTFLFDAPVEIGMQRAKNRHVEKNSAVDRIEQEKFAFFEKVRQGYVDRAKQFPNRIVVIDASLALSEVKDLLSNYLADVC